MDVITFRILASKEQFKWLADQLRAVRSIRDRMAGQAGVNPFGSPLKSLSVLTRGASDCLTSYVNAGMQGFSSVTLSQDVWKSQFQYRALGAAGIMQFDDGDLYIPAMVPHTRLKVEAGCKLEFYPITSAIFRVHTDAPAPYWEVQLFRNERPKRKSPVKKGG